MTVTPLRIERPSLRDLRPLKGAPARARGFLTRYLAGRHDGILASLPVGAALCFTAGAWDVARPLGFLVAGVALLMLEVRFTPEDSR